MFCLRFYITATLFSFLTLSVLAQPFNGAANSSAKSASCIEVLEKMFDACSQINCMQFDVRKQERINNQYIHGMSTVKLQIEPFCVYLKQQEPTAGLEALFRAGENNDKVLVNPNGFPWMNLSLDPYGSLIRKNQHHLIHDIGFGKFNGVLKAMIRKYGSDIESMTHLRGETIINGKKCLKIEFHNPDFHLLPYTTGANETTLSIANKLTLSEYRILELNKDISSFGPIKPGVTITITSDYSPKLVLYVDQQLWVPVKFEVYDEANVLFESYEYQNIKVNVKFASDELKSEFKEYGF